jgi:excisionase family DNA binding protein
MSLITRKEAASFLGVSEATLRKWAWNKLIDLPFYKVGRTVRYSIEDLEEFLVRNKVHFEVDFSKQPES